MSHFSGLVFLRPNADLDETLAPFDEQNALYMELDDKTDEVKELFDDLPDDCPTSGTFIKEDDKTDLINQIWDEAADAITPEDEGRFWTPYSKDKFPTPADIARDKGFEVVPDETKRGGVRFVNKYETSWEHEPSKAKYPTLDKLAKEYFGYREVNGRYGYMSNPNAKYDWYYEGGKWDGFLCLKTGCTANVDMLTEVDWEKTDTPFCFVDTEGEWHEKGKMGWFAMVSNEKKQEDWDREFKSYVENLLKNDLAREIKVCIIDFHI